MTEQNGVERSIEPTSTQLEPTMTKLITLDEAIEWGKRGELCDLMTEDDQRQIAEWLRQARGAEAATRWYTAKLREAETENAKLVDVLHEVETEAVYAYHCLQQDCVTTANSSEHFFKKWWHIECECDRLKAENATLRQQLADATESMGRVEGRCAKLRELARNMLKTIQVMDAEWHSLTDFTTMAEAAETYDFDAENALEYEEKLRELGVDA